MLKQTKRGIALSFALLAIGLTGILVHAAEPEKTKVEFGAAVPDFTLNDYDGKEHSLKAYEGKIVVLDFSSQECPYSRGTDPNLAQLAADYEDKPVVVLSIDSHKDTTPEQIKQYAAKNKLPYPILKDAGNKYADLMGAKQTPEIFVLDSEHKLAYHGAFDNRKDPAKAGDVNHVRNAIDNILAGKPVEPREVNAWGCTIKRIPKPKESS